MDAKDLKNKVSERQGKADAPKMASAQDEQQKKKIAELENQLKKALADYQNLRKDMDKRLEFERSLVMASVIKRLIELSDSIDIALSNTQDDKSWREGVRLILEKSKEIYIEMGAEIIDCEKGDEFSPEFHEAIGVVDEGEDGTIAKVIQNGYKFNEMLIRPARVIVNKHP